jgi:predicted  nucleic acid-binding Zn-ribbon protein|tara:strand:+ start:1798 stop:2400 length:603 start_codon:yes stop_codon:yes gene_type:complete
MAEVEYKGIKVGGSKLLLILPLLGTIGGGLWGGFELWHRYQAMETKINKYVAPDLSGFDKKLAIINKVMSSLSKEMASVRLRVGEIQTLVRDTKADIRSETDKVYSSIGAVSKRSRSLDAETRGVMRQAEKIVREVTANNEKNVRDVIESAATRMDNKINSANTRFDTKISSIDTKLDILEKRVLKAIKRALDNPLLKRK